MTRDFNKQRRDDSRPPFRQNNNSSFDRHGEERSPRPARPRLSREVVDRAWENGAQNRHADYRPRQSGQGPAPRNGAAPRNDRRNYQQSERSPYQNGNHAGGGKPYGYRQNSYDNAPDNHQGNYRRNDSNEPRSRPYDSERNGFDGPRSRGFDRDRRDGYSRPNPRNYERSNERPFRDRANRYDGNDMRDEPRRQHGGYSQNPRGQHQYGERRNYRQDERSERNGAPYNSPYQARFEGDYERFDRHDDAQSRQHTPNRRTRGQYNDHQVAREEVNERHVTRLPDGRVLKGSRPAQRKNAQFWTEIAQGTDELIEHVQTPSTMPEDQMDTVEEAADSAVAEPTIIHIAENIESAETVAEKPARKPRSPRSAASSTKKSAETKASKPRSSGPKPSQRGFKWPTP